MEKEQIKEKARRYKIEHNLVAFVTHRDTIQITKDGVNISLVDLLADFHLSQTVKPSLSKFCCVCGHEVVDCDIYCEVCNERRFTTAPPDARWISVEDRLPESEKEVLIIHGRTTMILYPPYQGSVELWGYSHWLPIPPLTDEPKNAIQKGGDDGTI